MQLRSNQPIFQETLLGWLVGGKCEIENAVEKRHSFFLKTDTKKSDTELLNETVSKFWDLESIPTKRHLTKDEEKCENLFSETHSRDENGRYIVRLPLKDNFTDLGESKSQAMKRFHSLEYRMSKNPILRTEYTDFVNDYIDRGHMKMLSVQEELVPNMSYFLPHHAVLKPSSSTTKLRVVFDASANTTTNLSLNDVLYTGPTVQQNLFNIVLRFRKHRFVLTSDISKMYRQVVVHPNDSPLQRILWRPSLTEPIKCFELTTVTYGTAAAPYLATRSLVQLSEDEKIRFPTASKVLRDDFYVDDVLTGANTIAEAQQLQSDLIKLLACGGFKLHKWSSNSAELMKNIPVEDREVLRSGQSSEKDYIGTLGLYWNPDADVFVFNIPLPDQTNAVTKRTALSNAAKLFDPLGLASPSTIVAKLFIQKLWKLKSDWDDPIPTDLSDYWSEYLSQLPELNRISFPRYVVRPESVRLELHGFADASERAYGCCVYLRSIDKNNVSEVHLLCSKSRVAPLKTVSLPRLELCAALLLSELVNVIIESMEITFDCVMLWSDSLITIQWIKIDPSKLKVFVANRVSQINELTAPFKWNHVSTHNNPADLVSRGVMPSDLQKCSMWWNGPAFLHDPNLPASNAEACKIDQQELELKKEVSSFAVSNSKPFFIDFSRYSSFSHIVRVVAYILRWKNKSISKCSPLSVDELDYARIKLLTSVQKFEFSTEYRKLSENMSIDSKSKLKCLNPFIEPKTELLRVGGRLSNCDLEFDVKHQIILPYNHRLTMLIFREYHQKNMHAGAQLLLSLIRQRYWPICGKITAKTVTRNCVTCFRAKPTATTQIMGSLPSERVQSDNPKNMNQ